MARALLFYRCEGKSVSFVIYRRSLAQCHDGTYAIQPQNRLTGIKIQAPMETMALACSLSYPIEATNEGAYELRVDDGDKAAMVNMTWGISFQFVN